MMGERGVEANGFKQKRLVVCMWYTPYTLKYHLDVVNHWKVHALYLCKRRDQQTRLALKATWWVMCVWERAVDTAEVGGWRCYWLTHQHTVTTEPRLMTGYVSVCVHTLHWSSSDICIIINHTHTYTHLVSLPSSGLSCCFMASPATIEGWQPHSARGRRGNGRGRGGEMWFQSG